MTQLEQLQAELELKVAEHDRNVLLADERWKAYESASLMVQASRNDMGILRRRIIEIEKKAGEKWWRPSRAGPRRRGG
jgi:hypothetical protein